MKGLKLSLTRVLNPSGLPRDPTDHAVGQKPYHPDLLTVGPWAGGKVVYQDKLSEAMLAKLTGG